METLPFLFLVGRPSISLSFFFTNTEKEPLSRNSMVWIGRLW